ncbi:MAG: hypothetical protein J6U54_01240 [Clostridiales bacterium]|nr:hypothetical protein [Clostridiales bacterium]
MGPDEIMGALFEALMSNPEIKKSLLADAAKRADRMVGTQAARRQTRAMIDGDPDKMKMFVAMCAKYDLNQMIVQNLGNIKAMLANFDANDYSTVHAEENLQLFKGISNVLSIATMNISLRHDEIMKELGDPNENRNGDSSG